MAASPAGAVMQRLRISIEGIVQGVGFRPFVFQLASRLGVAGWVRNDSRGVTIEAEAEAASSRAIRRRPAGREAPAGHHHPTDHRRSADYRGQRLHHPCKSGRSDRPRPDPGRCQRLRRLPARTGRPRRPPLPLPLHQLHQLRAALHHRHRHPLRPAADHHGRLHHVPGLSRRVSRPRLAALPCPAECLPALRPASVAARRQRPAAAG